MSSWTVVAGSGRDQDQGHGNDLTSDHMVRSHVGHHMVAGDKHGGPYGNLCEVASHMAGTSAVTVPYGRVIRFGAPPTTGAIAASDEVPSSDARVGAQGLYICDA